MLTLDKVYHAGYVLKNVIRKTDVIKAPRINPDADVYLKTDMQKDVLVSSISSVDASSFLPHAMALTAIVIMSSIVKIFFMFLFSFSSFGYDIVSKHIKSLLPPPA